MCVNRVRGRKSLGGHTVPSETIHRRYHAGIRNFFELYEPIAYRWKFFYNTKKPESSSHPAERTLRSSTTSFGLN
jgi:predicted ABC-type ATPase